jgi:hypothetical protein
VALPTEENRAVHRGWPRRAAFVSPIFAIVLLLAAAGSVQAAVPLVGFYYATTTCHSGCEGTFELAMKITSYDATTGDFAGVLSSSGVEHAMTGTVKDGRFSYKLVNTVGNPGYTATVSGTVKMIGNSVVWLGSGTDNDPNRPPNQQKGAFAFSASMTVTARPQITYKVNSVSFEDRAKRRSELAIEDKIYVQRKQVGDATKGQAAALHVYLAEGDRATQAGIAWSLKEKAFEAAQAKWESLFQSVLPPSPRRVREELTAAEQSAKQLFAELPALATAAANARKLELDASNRYQAATDNLTQQQAGLIQLQEQLHELQGTSSLKSLTLTADGTVVYQAAFTGVGAHKLDQFDGFRAWIEAKLRQAVQDRDASESIALASNADAQLALDDLHSAIMDHADAKFVTTVFKGMTAALQGAAEGGGLPGALQEVVTWAAFELLTEDVPNDLELGQAVEAEFNGAAKQPAWAKLVTPEKFAGYSTRYAVPWLGQKIYGPLVNQTKDLVTSFFESGNEQLLKSMAGYPELEAAFQRVSMQNQQLERGVAKLVALRATGWRQALNSLSPKTTTGIRWGAAAAAAYATYKINKWFESQAAEAWGNYILAQRVADAQAAIYIQQSQYWRALNSIENVLVSSEQSYLNQAQARGGFDNASAAVFNDGATVTLTTDPPINDFGSVSAELGGERMSFGTGHTLSVKAADLQGQSDNPRLVTLSLSLGK